MELSESINAVLRAEEHERYTKEDFSEKPLVNLKTLLNIYKDFQMMPLPLRFPLHLL